MTLLLLTLDLGNSRGKLRVWRVAGRAHPVCVRHAVLEGGAELPARIAAWLAEAPAPQRAVLSSVASTVLEGQVVREVGRFVGAVTLGPPPGIHNLCRHPETTGADRLYAARGALETVGESAIVVDAGTALTVDAAVLRPDGGREFLGGSISPGPHLAAQALATGAARLPLVDPRPGGPVLGRDTEEAIGSGVVTGFRGAARALVEGIAAAAGLEGAPVVVSGGARRFLLEPCSFLGSEPVVVPGLVHLGLLHAGWDVEEGGGGDTGPPGLP